MNYSISIFQFIKNKNQYLLNSSMVTNNDFNSELCSKPSRIEITGKLKILFYLII